MLCALDHLPPALPYKMMNSSFFVERFVQSIDALQQIALQNKGVPGRKNIVWVGHGGPNLSMAAYNGLPVLDELKEYARATTNMLVDARITLFVISGTDNSGHKYGSGPKSGRVYGSGHEYVDQCTGCRRRHR